MKTLTFVLALLSAVGIGLCFAQIEKDSSRANFYMAMTTMLSMTFVAYMYGFFKAIAEDKNHN